MKGRLVAAAFEDALGNMRESSCRSHRTALRDWRTSVATEECCEMCSPRAWWHRRLLGQAGQVPKRCRLAQGGARLSKVEPSIGLATRTRAA